MALPEDNLMLEYQLFFQRMECRTKLQINLDIPQFFFSLATEYNEFPYVWKIMCVCVYVCMYVMYVYMCI